LVHGLRNDVSPHFWSNDSSFSALSWKAFVIIAMNEWLSADSASSKDIHDKVHPQQLDNFEGWLTDRAG
jgi:hypothetical protein